MLSTGLVLALALGLSGCAARSFTSIAMVQPGDDALSCDALKTQIADNNVAIVAFQRKDKQVENGNIAKGVGSAIPYVGILIAMSSDLSNEEQVKARALIDRNERLVNLAKQKGCTQ